MIFFWPRTLCLNLSFRSCLQTLKNSTLATIDESLQQAPELCRSPSASGKLSCPLASTILCLLQDIASNWYQTSPACLHSVLLLLSQPKVMWALSWKPCSWSSSSQPSFRLGCYFLVVNPWQGEGSRWWIWLTGNQTNYLSVCYIFISL